MTLAEDRCALLEETNRELEEQRNMHMKHANIVLKDKKRLLEELHALKEASIDKIEAMSASYNVGEASNRNGLLTDALARV